GRALGVLPGADQEIRAAITVDVARLRGADAEAVARVLACEGEEALLLAARVDVDAPRVRALGGVVPVGGVEVTRAVAVEVAGEREEHLAERDARRLGLDGVEELGLALRVAEEVHAPALVRARVGGAGGDQGRAVLGDAAQ